MLKIGYLWIVVQVYLMVLLTYLLADMLTPASTIFLLLFVREGLYALPGRAKDDSPPYLELAREIVTKYLTMKQQRASDDKTAETAEEGL